MRRLRRLLEALGPPGVIGIGVLLFCLPFYFSALVRRRARARAAQRARQRSRAHCRRSRCRARRRGRARALLRRFPPLDGAAAASSRRSTRTRAPRGCSSQQGEYRLETGAGLAAYRVTLPVRGSYAQLRQFVGRVLKDMPTASLDAVRFERRKPGDAQLEAQVRLTIYLRPVEGKGI